MIKLKLLYFLLLFFVFSCIVCAQNFKKINELKSVISKCKEDTVKIEKLLDISQQTFKINFNTSMLYANQAFELAEKLKFAKGMANAYNTMADAYWFHLDYEKAQLFYFKAYRINDSIHDQKSLAYSLYNIGWVMGIQQNNTEGLNYLYKSLRIYISLKDTLGSGFVYNGLASYFQNQYKQINCKAYFDSAIIYFNKSMVIAKKNGSRENLGASYLNIGELFYDKNTIDSSFFYTNKGLDIYREIQDSTNIMNSFLMLAKCHLILNHAEKALDIYQEAYTFYLSHDLQNQQISCLKGLSEVSYKLGNYKDSYNYYQKYTVIKEKSDKEIYNSNFDDLKTSYSLQKSEGQVKELNQANEIQLLKNKKNTYFIFALIGFAIAILIIALLLMKQNKQKQLVNYKLQLQNKIISEKKQEIDHSIQYAKGIQQAVLPDESELSNQFGQSFILYKPKDVVSGDFYWFGKINNDFYCIVADCTGHGVPGALMSIIGAEKIGQAIREKNITQPETILSFLNHQIKYILKQHSDQAKQKDGMDLVLLKFNTISNEVEFCGANRPLYLVRNKELIEYKPDKVSLGGFTSEQQPFTTTKISLQKNDSLYLFTDGYADQFGGNDGKKFMTKNLKNLFIAIAELSADQQKEKIDVTFNTWQKDYEQVDDVLVIGIKIDS